MERLSNEAETRYSVCDPVISLLCDTFNFKVKLEESIKENIHKTEQEEEEEEAEVDFSDTQWAQWENPRAADEPAAEQGDDPRASIGSVMSKGNKADYAVYTF